VTREREYTKEEVKGFVHLTWQISLELKYAASKVIILQAADTAGALFVI